MKTFLTSLLIIPIILAGFTANAASVYVVPPVAGTDGEDAGLRSTLYELVKAAVSEESGYSLAVNSKEADFQLNAKHLKLGGSYIISVDKINGEKVTYTAKMKASNADDLDTVAGRTVRAALRETKAEETAHVDDVTLDEITKNTRRTQTTRQWKFGFGPAWGDQMNTDKSGILFTLGFVWGIDANFDLDLAFRSANFEKTNETGASFTEFLIGTNYYLSPTKTAAFLTAGVGRAGASVSTPNSILISNDTASGWSARVGFGYKFFRTSTVNLGVEVNYSKVFAESSRSKSSPGVTSAALALYY